MVSVSSVSKRVMTENSVAIVIEVNLRAKAPARSAHIFRIMAILSLEKKRSKNGIFRQLLDVWSMTYVLNGLGFLGDLIGSIYIWNVCHLK